MTKRLLLSAAVLTAAALSLPAQEAASSLPALAPGLTPPPGAPGSTLPALPLNKITLGARPAALAAPNDNPTLSEAEILKQIDELSKGTPILRMPKVTAPRSSQGDSGGGTTEITANEGNFDQKAHVAIFMKEVYVENPDFTVNCDKLTAYLHHEEKPDADAGTPAGKGAPGATPAAKAGAAAGARPGATPKIAGAKATPTSSKAPKVSTATSGNASIDDRTAVVGGPPKPATSGSGGLEKAICEGNVTINQDKIDPDGTITHNIGHSKKAIYETATGNITLYGKPDVEQGVNTCTALKEDTIIVLNRAGQMQVHGAHRSDIRDSGSSDSSGSGGSSGAPK